MSSFAESLLAVTIEESVSIAVSAISSLNRTMLTVMIVGSVSTAVIAFCF